MRVNLIPMAGAGKRFADAGYATPKPWIPVDDRPMALAAAQALPLADRTIVLCRAEHLQERDVAETFRPLSSNVTVLTVPALTEGQAATCLLAQSSIPDDAELTIGACDNDMVWNRDIFTAKMQDPAVDALIWVFRHFPPVATKPEAYGWVAAEEDGRVTRVSVKVPLSTDPLEDFAVVGTFTFKRAADFFQNVERMIKENRRIRHEFYIDECMNVCIENGLRVHVFEVDKYVGWGSPDELRTYQYWHRYFSSSPKS